MTERDERDEFDRIVEGLELDVEGLPDLDEAAAEHARREEERQRAAAEADELPHELRDADEVEEEPFYRQVPPARLRPARGTGLAWAGVAAAPVLALLSAVVGFWLPAEVLAVLTLVAVVSVAWLVWHLPERGPSHRDWPDDGAAL
ncbi:hypothetical protein EHW97_10790 [Aeromicrobium camelliae]|uniref:DUF3040 domain-containing protein n=1 Tax=Aeromicrobium camelliae TaxID=1538144 RepID=A0A3N6W6L6_9ACTN|nr:hypothetical protein [Aeromicrobium camelliae]RQN03159.1 hypothetical protein EHW97_10790 [Aeromicrobium camelliae]